MTLRLKPLSILDGKAEWQMLQDLPTENGFNNDGYGIAFEDFPEWLIRYVRQAHGIDLPDGFMPQHYYWLMRDDQPIGLGKLRPTLSNNLLVHGGNIGYGICQEVRGNGYANTFVELLLDKARSKGMDIAMMTVKDDNTASFKAIENNDGVLEKTVDGSRYYWVYL